MLVRLVFGGLIAINIVWFLIKPSSVSLGINWWNPLVVGFIAGLWLATEVEARQ